MKKHKIVPMIEKLEFSLNRVARKFCGRRKKKFCHAVDGADGNNPNSSDIAIVACPGT